MSVHNLSFIILGFLGHLLQGVGSALLWSDENICTAAIYLPAGLRGGRTR